MLNKPCCENGSNEAIPNDAKQIGAWLTTVSFLDSNEVYAPKKIALNGVKDIIWEYLEVIAAAVGIPATRFLSASPSGMNATGESDLVNYIDLLVAIQNMEYRPRLKVLDQIVQAHFGLPAWKYKWRCIFPESSAQKETREKDTVASLVALVEAGVKLTLERRLKMFCSLRTFIVVRIWEHCQLHLHREQLRFHVRLTGLITKEINNESYGTIS